MRGGIRAPLWDRLWAKVEVGDCWEWTGATTGEKKYGRIALGHDRAYAVTHRVAWELLVGPIPEGYQIDHLCRNHRCVNPDHLEVVTGQVNALRGYGVGGRHARQTHCVNGHPFDDANTRPRFRNGRWGRECRTCAHGQYWRAKARRAA